MTIVALAAGTFSLVAVAGPAQALAETGKTSTTVSTTTTLDGTTVSLSGSLTVAPVSPNDSSWD
jgi:hypothetical protein